MRLYCLRLNLPASYPSCCNLSRIHSCSPRPSFLWTPLVPYSLFFSLLTAIFHLTLLSFSHFLSLIAGSFPFSGRFLLWLCSDLFNLLGSAHCHFFGSHCRSSLLQRSHLFLPRHLLLFFDFLLGPWIQSPSYYNHRLLFNAKI